MLDCRLLPIFSPILHPSTSPAIIYDRCPCDPAKGPNFRRASAYQLGPRNFMPEKWPGESKTTIAGEASSYGASGRISLHHQGGDACSLKSFVGLTWGALRYTMNHTHLDNTFPSAEGATTPTLKKMRRRSYYPLGCFLLMFIYHHLFYSYSLSAIHFLAIFPFHLSKVLRLPRKSDARSYEVLHLSRKIILANLNIWCSKMQPLSGNQRPDLLTALMNMSLVLRLPQKMHLGRSSSNFPRLPNATKPSRFAHFWQGAQSIAPATRNDIWTSKSGANMWCFVHLDFEMCFAPQRRALFRHLNFQKWSDTEVFYTFDFELCFAPQRPALFRHRNFQKWSERVVLLTFSLTNVLRATTACNFSSLIWPAGSAPAALASLLFDPPEPQIIGKTQCFATFLPFRASASSFFWLFLFSDLLSSTLLFSLPLPSSAFHLYILSEVWLPNFLW